MHDGGSKVALHEQWMRLKLIGNGAGTKCQLRKSPILIAESFAY
jgi:hypothetical protein